MGASFLSHACSRARAQRALPRITNPKNNGEGLAPFPTCSAMDCQCCLRRNPQAYAASAPLAFSASAAKPAASCTAMSASTLRSRVMPAFSMPFMKRL